MADATEKIHKIMARAGVASRRACQDLIAQGRVQVDGRVATVADRADPLRARITVDGHPLQSAPEHRYVMLHKPAGYITTARDPQGRPTVLQLVADIPTRLFPVGRLDYDSSGLLLLTNDGELAHALTHPSHEVPRTYLVTVRRCPDETQLRSLRQGLMLEDGMTAPAGVEVVSGGEQSVLRMVMHEGKKRQIKRMCAAVGCAVARLHRVRMGNLELGALPAGKWRELSRREVEALRKAARC